MPSTSGKKEHVLLLLASFVIVIAGVKSAQSIIAPFLLAVFIAVMSAPAVFWLEQKGLPKFIAFLSVALGVMGVLSVIVIMVGGSLNTFMSQLPELQNRLLAVVQSFIAFLNNQGIELDLSSMPDAFQPTQFVNAASGVLRSISKVLSSSFLIFLMVAFILFETSSLRVKMRLILGRKSKESETVMHFMENLKRYLAIKTLASFATGLIIGFLLWSFGVKYALLWGIIAFLLNYIPAIGSIVAAIPAVLVSLVEHDTSTVGMVIAIFLVTNIVIGNIIEPRFLGKGLGLSPLVILLSLMFWGWVLGPIGMFLAVPITMSITMGLHTMPHTRWIAIMLSNKF